MLDINECENQSLNNCSASLLEECHNTQGGFECNCLSGYGRQSRHIACKGAYFNLVQYCSTVLKYKCELQIDNNPFLFLLFCFCFCYSDIDECTEDTAICGIYSTCNNTVGNFTCDCLDGYEQLDRFHCRGCNNSQK